MTPAQESHLAEILNKTSQIISTKYRNGQAEHGGNLFDMSLIDLIDNGIAEAADQLTYLLTARSKALDLMNDHRGVMQAWEDKIHEEACEHLSKS